MTRDRNEEMPIHLAAGRNIQTAVKMLLEIAPEDQVLQVDNNRRTPLRLLCEYYRPSAEILKMLLKTAPQQQIRARDNHQRAPIHLAVEWASKKIHSITFRVLAPGTSPVSK